MKKKDKVIREIMDRINKFDAYQRLFDEIDRDIKRQLERDKKKRLFNSGNR